MIFFTLFTASSFKHLKGLLKFALEFYCTQIHSVLSTFGKSVKCVNLPEDLQEFVKVIKRCVILDFLNVVVINPIFQIPNPRELRNWYRKRMRHEERIKQGKSAKPPVLPLQDHIFTKHNFIKFANQYLKVGHLLGGFQELNNINLEIIRETAFCDKNVMNSPAADEHENDIYEDEEIELSDEEEQENIEGQDNELSLYSRISRRILEMFNCNKCKAQ